MHSKNARGENLDWEVYKGRCEHSAS